MSELIALVNGVFGKITVVELSHKLVPHAHSDIQFCYWLTGGEAHGVVNDEQVVYCEGMAVGINKYQAHDLVMNKNVEPMMLLSLNIDEKWFDSHFSSRGFPISFCKAQHTVTNEMKAKCWALVQKIHFSAKKNSLTLEQDVRLLIKLTIENNAQAIKSNSNLIRNEMQDKRLRLVISYLHNHNDISQVDSTRDFMKLAGLSRSQLYALFKNKLQSSPKLIWDCALLDSAINHMSNSTDNLSIISRKFGFSSAANFSRFFRLHKGITPTVYRKNHTIIYTSIAKRDENQQRFKKI